jgi:hypothetical protein
MATFTRTWTFTAGTKVKTSEVNKNFTDVSTFLNNSVVHVDGSKAFTGIPSVATGIDPSTANHLSRKAYVDAGDLLRPRVPAPDSGSAFSAVIGGTPTVGTSQFLVQAGTYSGSTNSTGTLANNLSFPTAFPNGLLSLMVVPVYSSTRTVFYSVRVTAQNKAGFNVDAWELAGTTAFGLPYNLNPCVSQTIKFNWIAIGW